MKCKSCFLGRMEKYFKMSSVENFTQNVKRYGLHKQIAHGSVHGKTDNKACTCTRRWISLHTLSLHISSLIWAFANRMYLLQSMGLTKRLVRRAKTRVNLRNCIFWSEHSLIVFNFDSRAVQTGITSVTFWSDPSLIVQYAPSSDSRLSKKLPYIVGRCTDWPESLLVPCTLYYSTFCRPVQAFHMGL